MKSASNATLFVYQEKPLYFSQKLNPNFCYKITKTSNIPDREKSFGTRKSGIRKPELACNP